MSLISVSVGFVTFFGSLHLS